MAEHGFHLVSFGIDFRCKLLNDIQILIFIKLQTRWEHIDIIARRDDKHSFNRSGSSEQSYVITLRMDFLHRPARHPTDHCLQQHVNLSARIVSISLLLNHLIENLFLQIAFVQQRAHCLCKE